LKSPIWRSGDTIGGTESASVATDQNKASADQWDSQFENGGDRSADNYLAGYLWLRLNKGLGRTLQGGHLRSLLF
jgi:hypothetical protein